MNRRLYFNRIDSSGTFRSGDVRLDVRFHDEEGNKYVWFPKWNDLRNLYAEAEQVEEMNPTGEEELFRLKELKQIDDAVLVEIAEVIADTWTGDDLGRFFEQLGHDTDYNYQTEEYANTFPAETGGADRVRKQVVFETLRELNAEDYELVVEVVEKAASPKKHIDQNDRRESVLYRLNKAIEHEGWKVTREGKVEPIQSDEDGQ